MFECIPDIVNFMLLGAGFLKISLNILGQLFGNSFILWVLLYDLLDGSGEVFSILSHYLFEYSSNALTFPMCLTRVAAVS